MHSHSHGHDNSHDDDSTRRIGWAFFLNVGFTLIEFVGGVLTNSTAIMADAVHDLGDSLSIGLAWLLARLSRKPISDDFSYGYRRFSLLGSLLTGIVMVVGSVWVLNSAIPRLQDPVMPVTEGMLGLAIFKEWPILDPILSIGFTLFVLLNVVRNLWKTLRLFLQGTPEELSLGPIREKLGELDGVAEIHHLHVWSLDGEQHVLTAHLVLAHDLEVEEQLELKQRVAEALREFRFVHSTIELEFKGEPCRDSSES